MCALTYAQVCWYLQRRMQSNPDLSLLEDSSSLVALFGRRWGLGVAIMFEDPLGGVNPSNVGSKYCLLFMLQRSERCCIHAGSTKVETLGSAPVSNLHYCGIAQQTQFRVIKEFLLAYRSR